MASFTDVVLGLPHVAELVMTFQPGLFPDIRRRFRDYTTLTTFHALPGIDHGYYETSPGFSTTFDHHGGVYLSTEKLGLHERGDARFPLHLAICEGDLAAVQRIVQCRPDLAFAEAIETAFVHNQLHIVRLLMNLRSNIPTLRQRYAAVALPYFAIGHDDEEALALFEAYAAAPWPSDILQRAIARGLSAAACFIYPRAPNGRYADLLNDAAGIGDLRLVELLHAAGEACTSAAMDLAAANGHIDVVCFLHEKRTEGCTAAAMDGAAGGGHLAVVAFLHTHRSEGCTTAAMDEAAANGHLEVVRFLAEHRSEGAVDALDLASAGGYLDVVKYLHSLGSISCTTAALDGAASNGHTDVVHFLLEHRAEGGSRDAVVQMALEARHMIIVDELVAHGYPPHLTNVRLRTHFSTLSDADDALPQVLAQLDFLAAHYGHLPPQWMDEACASRQFVLVRRFYELGAPCTKQALTNAVNTDARDIANFLLRHRRQGCDPNLLKWVIIDSDDVDMLKDLCRAYPEHCHGSLLNVAASHNAVRSIAYLLCAGPD
ncbi:hypothetical protein ACHHYP_01620 [Achlya hypogyna]|uniref:Ankyrin repeat protein n=1 Tax=Achlya hypogyna TaxID=1202772 RepID=A0A1V9Z876_ACHHY|nr:hypothetical protein ACHHYP_01620 [Achlya hypogyna]